MTAPVPELIDLVAGRSVSPGPGLITSAIEHRLAGLLLSQVEAGAVTVPDRDHRTLIAADLAVTAHHRQLWSALGAAERRLSEAGVTAIALKGVADEARWYDRFGERPCGDVDLIVAPGDVETVIEVFGSALPSNPGRAELAALVSARQLQHLHFNWRGVPFDLHFDPLKLGLWIEQLDLVFSTATSVTGPDGQQVAVMSPELALIGHLTHLNKDRFSYLRAYGDVIRIIDRAELDWDLIDRFVRNESLQVPVWKSLTAVLDVVGPRDQVPIPELAGWRARMWDRLWPPASRLRGQDGIEDHRYHQLLIPALTGRWPEVAREYRRAVLPPRALLDYHRPDLESHGRLRRLSLDRLPLPNR